MDDSEEYRLKKRQKPQAQYLPQYDEDDYEEPVTPRRRSSNMSGAKEKSASNDRENHRTYRQDPKKPKISFFLAIWFVLTLPFRLIIGVTKNIKWFIALPIRIFLSLAFVGLVVGGVLIFIFGTIANRYDISEVKNNLPERTTILDRKNRVIGQLHGENRKRISLDEIPPIFLEALILREDTRFYSHGGVDWIGVARAVSLMIENKEASQGASTLTMQLAKITYNHKQRNLKAKLTEVALAKRIESMYSKKEILEIYINRIFWGHTFLGISAAARGYYNKEPKDLTLGECATLVGMIYGPNDHSPIKHPENAKKVRDIVLKVLLNGEKITQADYDKAIAEPIKTSQPKSRSEENYAMPLIRRELESILEEEDIRLGGLVVRTTLDLDYQNQVLDSLNSHLTKLEEKKEFISHLNKLRAKQVKAGSKSNLFTTRAHFANEWKAYDQLSFNEKKNTTQPRPNYIQGAVVVMNNATGALLCVVGGRDAEESQLNRAIQSRRQVGSLFKPFVYTCFFEQGYNANSPVSDNKIAYGEIKGAPRWSPRNSDGTYRGTQNAAYGLILSRNTMSARVGNIAGLSNVIGKAKLAGFQGRYHASPSLYLGTWEASPLDVASAFSVFANGGVRPTPFIIESINDLKGNPRFTITKTKRSVYQQRASNITSSILQQVCKPGGTAGKVQSLGFKAPCAGKTGTTNNYTNAWFAGYGSYLTASVWVGFDTETKILEKAYGGTLALPIWADVMIQGQKLGYPFGDLRSKPSADFGVAVQICNVSNQLAHTGCEAAKTAYYETDPGYVAPTSICTHHIPQALPLDEDSIPEATPIDEENIPLAEPIEDDIPTAEPI